MEDQLNLLGSDPATVHYFDSNGALHSGRLVRRIKKGRLKGKVVVEDSSGRQLIPPKVHNIVYND